MSIRHTHGQQGGRWLPAGVEPGENVKELRRILDEHRARQDQEEADVKRLVERDQLSLFEGED